MEDYKIVILFVLGLLYLMRRRKKYPYLKGNPEDITSEEAFLALSGIDILAEDNEGAYGEYLIFELLWRKYSDGHVLTNLYVPHKDRRTEVDIIFIHNTGIYVIESKSLTGKIYGNEKYKDWSYYLGGKRYSFFNPIWQNNTHLNALVTLLDVRKKDLTSYVVFGRNSNIDKVVLESDKATVMTAKELDWILGDEINSRKRRYSKRHMRKVANKLFRYALASDRVKKKHVRRIQKLYR